MRGVWPSVALALLLVEPAFGQPLGQGGDDGISTWRVVAALGLCLALAVAGAFALRARMGGGSSFTGIAIRPRRLRLVESLRLPNQTSLSIIACDDREMLVATSSAGTELLDRWPPPAPKQSDPAGQG